MSKRTPPRVRQSADRRAGQQEAARQQARAAAQRRRVTVAAALAALVVAGGAGYLSQERPSPSSTSALAPTGALPPVEFPEPGVVHVHGLGVDPADGRLYAATHSGLFEVPQDGQARRIADRHQDTMGFTVAGPGRFLGSGHPDPREDDVRPPLLGLIASTDQGQTWERKSLHGEADFHALEAAHGKVYGYDATSSTFMVSEDEQDWDRRARLPMRDFAVSPAEAEVVLATTQQGLARSSDGGRTWQVTRSAPTLAVLAWGRADSLYGVGPEGQVHASADGGRTWTARGDVDGEPEAVTVDTSSAEEVLYVAAREKGILASRDGGRTFSVRYRES